MWPIERDAHVAVVTMSSNKVNAQNVAFFDDLLRTFDRLEKDFADCAVVLTGTGKVFSAGLDLKQVLPLFATGDHDAIAVWWRHYRTTNERVFGYPRPTVAAVNGHAFAGGLITALACDFRVVCDGEARFSLNEVRIGIPMPSIYVEIIRCAVGSRVARLLCLGAREYSVRGAHALGLFDEVVEPDALVPRATAIAADLAPDTHLAYANTKRNLHAASMRRIAEISSTLDDDLPRVLSAPDSLRAQATAFEKLTGAKLPQP